MQWNVFYHDVNKDKITTLDIFKHGGFRRDVEKALQEHDSFEEFAEELRRTLFYYFWAKCEYEIIILPWCGSKETTGKKVDVYTQVMNNWGVFLNYVWSAGKSGI